MTLVRYDYTEKKRALSGQKGEVTVDLPEKGYIPEITLTLYSTPTAATNPALPLSEAITKVEVIAGGKTIKSYSGNTLKGLSMIHKYKKLASPEINMNGTEGQDNFHILLGGKFNGVEYAPDMSRLNNPQLKVSYDYSLTTGERGASYDATSSPSVKLTVLSKIIEGNTNIRHGYVQTTEISTYDQSADHEERTTLPNDGPMVGFGVRAGYNGKNLTDDLYEVKLDINNSEKIPLSLSADEVISIQNEIFGGPFEYEFGTDMIDGVAYDVHMGLVTNVTASAAAAGGRSVYWLGGAKGVSTFEFTDVATPTAISTYEQIRVKASGYAPFGVWYVPARALTGGASDLLDTSKYKTMKLVTKASASASSSSKPKVIAEYLVTK